MLQRVIFYIHLFFFLILLQNHLKSQKYSTTNRNQVNHNNDFMQLIKLNPYFIKTMQFSKNKYVLTEVTKFISLFTS